MDGQISFIDIEGEKYDAFVKKFEPKKTTDDCYTPPEVYEAVASYVERRYGLDRSRFVRPFFPGGDYMAYGYAPDAVVVDNPPFSIMRCILEHYRRRGIPFFLFAPALVWPSFRDGVTLVAAGAEVTYENGASVNTSFVTSLEPGVAARADPGLHDAVERAAREYARTLKRQVGHYRYDGHVLTAAMLNYLAGHGTALEVADGDARHIRALDSQRARGKTIFGGGVLLSEKAAAEKAAAEKAAAEKAAAEKAAAEVWELSDRERAIIRSMGGGRHDGS